MEGPEKKTKAESTKRSSWLPPTAYFDPDFEEKIQASHPVYYYLFVLLEFIALLGPMVLYVALIIPILSNSPWLIVGEVGAFFIGVGLINFAAILVKKYFGHLFSLLSILIGGLLLVMSVYRL